MVSSFSGWPATINFSFSSWNFNFYKFCSHSLVRSMKIGNNWDGGGAESWKWECRLYLRAFRGIWPCPRPNTLVYLGLRAFSCARICVHFHVRLSEYAFAITCVCVCVRLRERLHVHLFACVWVNMRLQLRAFACVSVQVCACVCVH